MTPLQASRALRDLARVPSRVSPDVARGIKREINRTFREGTDPYGRPLAPLRPATLAKGRHPPPMTDTGRAKRNVTVRAAQGAGVQILSPPHPLIYHFRRLGVRAARKMLPEGVLPSRYRKVWQRALDRAAKETLK